MSAGVVQTIKKSIDTAREAGNQSRYYQVRREGNGEGYLLRPRNLRVEDLPALAQKVLGCLGLHRSGEQTSLPQFAPQLLQVFELSAGFNTLGDRLQLQFVRQQNDQLHRIAHAMVSQHSGNQGAVDLQRFNGELPQRAQRGITHSKVIQDHADADLLEVREHRRR